MSERVRKTPVPEDLGGGIWSVPVPIPGNPLAYTLVYALESEQGLVLVDAGWEHEDAWAALRDGLGSLGLSVTDVSGVVVTHYHPDHAGLAGRVRDTSGAWIAMHHADAALVRTFRELAADSTDESWRLGAMRRAGADADEIAQQLARADHPDPPAAPDRELADGDLVDVPGRKLRVIWTPGHSPGHICLHLEDGDRIFTGDHVLPRITPHIGLYPYDLPDTDPLGDYLTSLGRIAEIEAGEVLPAHQYRFNGLAARAGEIAAHHEERLVEIVGLLSGDATTLWDVTAGMVWRQPWADMPVPSRQMAAGEAAAHLRTLEGRGLVRRHGGEHDLIRFVLG